MLEIKSLEAAFLVLLPLLQLALTLPVITAKCERTFCTFTRTITYLRSTMSEMRLNDMAILSIERDLSNEIQFDTVVDIFASKNRKIALS